MKQDDSQPGLALPFPQLLRCVLMLLLMSQPAILTTLAMPASTLAQTTQPASSDQVSATSQPENQPQTKPSPTPEADAAATQPSPASLPHIRINRQRAWVDFDARVVTREGQWVELLVCTPGTREYESILTTEARPSHLHLALMILAQTPGSPMSWSRQDDKIVPSLPQGPKVDILIRYMKDDAIVEVPAGQWVMNKETNQPLAQSTWLFTGSKFMELEGHPVYLADVNGSCISLVNFGDDLLTRPTNLSNRDDGGNLGANTAVIPPVGTNVVIRLIPQARQQDGKAGAPATATAAPATTSPAAEDQGK